MTSDERLLQRTNAQIAETGRHIRALADQADEYKSEWREEMRAMRADMAERDRVTDERIAELVSAIGAFIRKASEPNEE